MARLIQSPTMIEASGNKPKVIEEFIGRMNSETKEVSIARMRSPQGWEEPGQTPQFDEYSVVITGTLRVETENGTINVQAGQAIMAPKGEWGRYSTPHGGGAEYVAVCAPAFSPESVHRDEQ